MSNKNEVRTDLVTNATDPLAPARLAPSPSELETGGRNAFSQLVEGEGGYDSLPEAGKQAFRALGQLKQNDERFPAARQAALDAVRDAKAAGLFNPQAPASPQHIAQSKDPAVRNQAPTGTQGESAGNPAPVAPATSQPPQPAPTPSHAPPAGEPNTTTPAVKGPHSK